MGVRGFEMFCQKGSDFSFLLCVCRGWVRSSTSPVVKKITDPPRINKWLVPITKSLKSHFVAYHFLRYFLIVMLLLKA